MTPERPVTLRTIAEKANVSSSTVSLALRDHPRIPEATKERIRKIADSLGYQADFQVSQVMRQMRRQKASESRETIALLCHAERSQWPKHIEMMIERLEARCEMLGLGIEVFVFGQEMRDARLDRILKARGIRGVIISFMPYGVSLPQLDWQSFASVALGENEQTIDFHCVLLELWHSFSRVTERLNRSGYRRLGFVLSAQRRLKRGDIFRGAYEAYLKHCPEEHRVEPLEPKVEDESEFQHWIKTEKPQVVVSIDDGELSWLEKLGDVPNDYGYVAMALREPTDRISGFHMDFSQVGVAAVDFLQQLMVRGELGLPQMPRSTLLSSPWIEGETVKWNP